MGWPVLPPVAALRPDRLVSEAGRQAIHGLARSVRALYSVLPGLRDAASGRTGQPGEHITNGNRF